MIFLSYARKDKDLVKSLYDDLTRAGVVAWADFCNLLPGQKWVSEIKNAIKKADLFLVILTRNSVDKRGFIQKEIKIAYCNKTQLDLTISTLFTHTRITWSGNVGRLMRARNPGSIRSVLACKSSVPS